MSFILPSVDPLEVFGVYDRLLPGKERIVIRLHDTVNLSAFALLLGKRADDGSLIPAIDHFLWLGPAVVQGPGWVFVYTGRGSPTFGTESHTGEPLYATYWGKPNVILATDVEPAVVHINSVYRWSEDKTMREVVTTKNYLRDFLDTPASSVAKKK